MEYYLVPNKMTGKPDDHIARLTNLEITNFDKVVEKMTRRGLTSTDTEVWTTVAEMIYVINEELSLGRVVITPFAKFSPSITGIFKGKDDSFDLKRHKVKTNCSAGKKIKVDETKITFNRVKQTVIIPVIDSFLNYSTMEKDVIIPGGTAEITGELLKIDTEDIEQGIFISQNGNAVKIGSIVYNLPSKLVFNIPPTLTKGEYQLEVRNKSNNSVNIKSGIYKGMLHVL